jgi:hypothetical protein
MAVSLNSTVPEADFRTLRTSLFDNSVRTLDTFASHRYIATSYSNFTRIGKGEDMNHIRFVTIGSVLVFALTSLAWQGQTAANSAAPEVEEHLKMLAARLDLTSDQQARIKPALAEMMETMRQLEQDQSISSEQRAERTTAAHQNADSKVRKVLNDEQKKKLDQLEEESSPESHSHSGAH